MSLVELARYTGAHEAEIVRGRLAAAGIGAVVFDAGMNVADSSGYLVPARLLVLAEDEAAARACLAEDVTLEEGAEPPEEAA